MKKIINGKKYDTESAKALHKYGNNYHLNDFHHYSEILFRKKSGEYFLYGKGGPQSKYAIGHYGWSTGSERMQPFTVQEAKEWLEENSDADVYESIFGTVDE
jgi:hypothetical protein